MFSNVIFDDAIQSANNVDDGVSLENAIACLLGLPERLGLALPERTTNGIF
jgi:hypothetical protein